MAISCDALQVYEGSRSSAAPPAPRSRSGSSIGCSAFVRVGDEFSVGDFAELAHARSTSCWPPGGARSWSAGPASTCARRSATSSSPAGAEEVRRAVEEAMAARLRRLACRARPRVAPDPPNDRKRIARRSELQRAGLEPPRTTARRRSGPRPAPPDAARRADMDRAARRADRRAGRGDRRGGASRRSPTPSGRRLAHRPRGARLRRAARRRHRGDEARSRNYARRQLTWMRKIPNLHGDRPHRASATREVAAEIADVGAIGCGAVRFEKWQALGNDYLILEASRCPGS